jgi:hypothetical protein
MYVTDVIWWAFTAYAGLVAMFMVWFAFSVSERGG